MDQEKFIIGVDVGGTNTDTVLISSNTNSIIDSQKYLTSHNIVDGIFGSIQELLKRNPKKVSEIKACVIGTTQFVNAIIQKGGPTEQLERVGTLRLCGTSNWDYPPFVTIKNKELRQRIQGPSYYIDGGYYMMGDQEYTPFDEAEVRKCAQQIMLDKVHHIAITGICSIPNPSQERKVAEILSEECKKVNYQLSFTLSHELSKIDGFLERENATIINECLKSLSQRAFSSYIEALNKLGLSKTLLYISSNDGSIINLQTGINYPIFTFSASIINSLKGGAEIYQKQNSQNIIIVDIGGTSTDFAVISQGIPKTSSKFIEINGIRLNFRMPLVNTESLGGGTMVELIKQNNIYIPKINKSSVANQLKEKAICFGGDTLTNTDFALIQNSKIVIEGASKELVIKYFKENYTLNDEQIKELCVQHQHQIYDKIIKQIDLLIADTNIIQEVLLVGGGEIIVDFDYFTSNQPKYVKLIERQEKLGVANALGASLADITYSIEDKIDFKDQTTTERQLYQSTQQEQLKVQELERKCIEYLKHNGVKDEKDIGKIEERIYQLAYITEKNNKKKNIYVKYKGRLNWNLLRYEELYQIQQNQLKEIQIKGKYEDKNIEFTNKIHNFTKKIEFPQEKLQGFITKNKEYKLNLELKTYKEFKYFAYGCGILGSGGGGSIDSGLLLGKLLFEKLQKPLKIYDPYSLDENDLISFVAFIGAPSAAKEIFISIKEFDLSFSQLNKHYKGQLSGVYNGELGGLNGIFPTLFGYAKDIPVFDVSTMYRAYPQLTNILPYIHGNNGLPISYSKQNGLLDMVTEVPKYEDSTKSEDAYNQLLANLVVQHGFTMGISLTAINKKEVMEYTFLNWHKQAYEIGKIIYQEIKKNKRNPQDVIDNSLNNYLQKQLNLKSKFLIEGKIVKKQTDTGRFDGGFLYVKGNSLSTNQRMKITFVNEFLLCSLVELNEQEEEIKQTVLGTTPDLIVLLDADQGFPIQQEEVCFGLSVVVFAMQSDPKYTTAKALKSIDPHSFKFDLNHKSFF